MLALNTYVGTRLKGSCEFAFEQLYAQPALALPVKAGGTLSGLLNGLL